MSAREDPQAQDAGADAEAPSIPLDPRLMLREERRQRLLGTSSCAA